MAHDDEVDRLAHVALYESGAKAQFDLGFMYATGKGVPQDDAAAARFHRMAAQQGHLEAQCALGDLYANGRGNFADPDLSSPCAILKT